MTQRPLGIRSGFLVPRANFGAMRLPEDEDAAIELVRQSIDAGMRFIDTARRYNDSEIKIGKALKGGYRKKVILSTKWAPWVAKIEETDTASADGVRRRIDDSMKRLDVDYLDYFQIWNIDSPERFKQVTARGGMLDGIRKAVNEGLVGGIGVTTHDRVDNVLWYLPEMDWCDVLLVPYNLMNTHYTALLHAANQRGIGTLVINPLAGGRLTQSSHVLEELARRVGAASVPDLAIRYVLSNPNVDGLLSGVAKAQDITDTVASAEATPFTEEQMAQIDAVLNTIDTERSRHCNGCRFCLPCPEGIDIPAIMQMVFDHRVWGLHVEARFRYNALKTPMADRCAHCGSCEGKCPQDLDIVDELEYANLALGKGKPTSTHA